jgi:hypothetical protein
MRLLIGFLRALAFLMVTIACFERDWGAAIAAALAITLYGAVSAWQIHRRDRRQRAGLLKALEYVGVKPR